MTDEQKPAEVVPTVPIAEEAVKPGVEFQHVIITLADGRRGVFYGPALIREIEMKLNAVPKLVSIDFDPPKPIVVPITKEESKDADTKAVEQPAVTDEHDPNTGLEQKA